MITLANGSAQLVPLSSLHKQDEGSINKDILPKFDWDIDKFPLWLTQVNAVLESARWRNITMDAATTALNAQQLQALQVALLNYLSKDVLFYSRTTQPTVDKESK